MNKFILTALIIISLLFCLGCNENYFSWNNVSNIEIMMNDSTKSIQKLIILKLTKDSLDCQVEIDSLNEMKLKIQYIIPLNSCQKSSISEILNGKVKEPQKFCMNEDVPISLLDKYQYKFVLDGEIIDQSTPRLHKMFLVLKEFIISLLFENYYYYNINDWEKIEIEQKVQEIDYWTHEKPFRELRECKYDISKDSVTIIGDYDFEKEYDYSKDKKTKTNELLSHVNLNNTCKTDLYICRLDSIPDTLKLYVNDKLIYQLNTNYPYFKTKYDVNYSNLAEHLQNIRSIIEDEIE